VAVEDVFAAVNVRSALALAQSRGTVLAVAGVAGLPVYSYAPAVVKKTVTGRGRASKDQVARMVQVLVGLRRVPRADAADALAVAITHAHSPALGESVLAGSVLGAVQLQRPARRETPPRAALPRGRRGGLA
jgi:crossover junction endodeoxyribonuclease RuvC